MIKSTSSPGSTVATSSAALRFLFAAIESRFGGLSNLLDSGSRAEVIVNNEGLLKSADLQRYMYMGTIVVLGRLLVLLLMVNRS